MTIKKRIIVISMPLVFAYYVAASNFCLLSWAGNKEMVEEQVKELDELNKQVIRKIPDIPKNGHIDVKAKVLQKDKGAATADIQQLKITPKKTEPKGDKADNTQKIPPTTIPSAKSKQDTEENKVNTKTNPIEQEVKKND